MIKRIEKAFCRSYSKRGRRILLLVAIIIFITAAQLSVFVEDGAILIIVAFVCAFVSAVACRVQMSRKHYVHQKMISALHRKSQSDLFFSSIDEEIQNLGVQTYAEERRCIYIFATLNWLIVTSPNGCLICMMQDIKNVSSNFQRRKGKYRMKVDFFDGGLFSCPYEQLCEPLVEFINTSKGVVS